MDDVRFFVSRCPWRTTMLKGNNLDPDLPVDRWKICRYSPPGSVMIDVGVAHAGHGGIVVDLITPEAAISCLYFWGMARNFNVGDQALTASIRESKFCINK